MRPSRPHFLPLPFPFFFALFLLIIGLIVLIEIDVLKYAYGKIGISPRYIFVLLLLSLLGSYVNIPVAELPAEHMHVGQEVTFFGVRYRIPVVTEWPSTLIAVNVGGAVVPSLLSLYLLVQNGLFGTSLIGITLVVVIVHWLARPVQGVGVVVPIFIPPIVAASIALLLAPHSPAPLAYICGSLGTLIGADLLNLSKVRGLGTPIASIGGSGTFDGIFVTGILAVLLA